jgi:dihydrofolate synthase/folylpolyglutamate synthase
MTMTAYSHCLNSMFALRRFGIKLGLDTIRSILVRLGNPHQNYHCIHVAGTNGKGSVAAMLASVLRAGGYRTGLYTSPHLVKFNERILVDGRPIADEEVVALYEQIKQRRNDEREPTFFECATAMALAHFGRQGVDWAVIETGMGGRLDATNVIQPQLCIVTNISLEHRDYLGSTIEQIATEKAGIIKAPAPVITAVRQKAAFGAIQTAADRNKVPVYRLGRDFKVRRTGTDQFTYYGLDHVRPNMTPALPGEHQRENTALVLAACEVLNRKRTHLTAQQIETGLRNTRWPGRLEVVSQAPYLLLDGAHNLVAARALARYLTDHLKDRRITLVIGILDDKPYKQMLKALVPVCRRVVITRPIIGRALDPQILLAVVKDMGAEATLIESVPEAVRYALQTTPSDQAVCVAGSLYVVGEAKAMLEGSEVTCI